MATEAFEEIAADFEFLDAWEDRYRHVIDLGKGMPPLPDSQKNAATKVDGCASQVWIVPELDEGSAEPLFSIRGDSDAMIVRGLICILCALFNELPMSQVLRVDADAELARLDLHGHLSSQRSNGLRSMVGRIRQIAEMKSAADGGNSARI